MIKPPVLALAAMLTLAGCGSANTTNAGSTAGSGGGSAMSKTSADQMNSSSKDPSMTKAAGAGEAMVSGAYLTQAQYQEQKNQRSGTKIVYFFHAPWCPDCRATDESLTSTGVPAGLTVVKVDYDTATDLRRQYGVTQQHTFVQVDANGAELAKWSGSKSGEEIKSKTS